jgi:hypothetical protein
MSDPGTKKASWKQRIFHEFIEYWVNVAYLSVVFASFTQYRRLILAAHGVVYTDYWVAVIEALILAKVIMIGSVARLGRELERKPLIYSTLYKTAVFTVFVGAFKVAEFAIKGLFTGKGIADGLAAYADKGLPIVLANALVIFVGLIPFFGLKELQRVLGEKMIRDLFFRKRAD